MWSEFKRLSGWTRRYPGSTHYRSTDGNWYYWKGSTFARDYGRTNPMEDFAAAMQVYHSIYMKYGQAGIYQSPGARTGIQHKLKVIDKMFEIYDA